MCPAHTPQHKQSNHNSRKPESCTKTETENSVNEGDKHERLEPQRGDSSWLRPYRPHLPTCNEHEQKVLDGWSKSEQGLQELISGRQGRHDL